VNEQDGVHLTFVDTVLKDAQLPRDSARRSYRTYSAQFKADLVAACQRPGASVAALATLRWRECNCRGQSMPHQRMSQPRLTNERKKEINRSNIYLY